MPSDYDQIRSDNIKEYGEGERHLPYLGNLLYSDRTHFVFEVLQNAEDAKASKVRFIVSQDKLEVMHDGRSFTEQDVRGVCGIGEGKKTDDLTKIGRFGIGFKSVYAYTDRPEIHSGDEHFCVEKYVRPHAVSPRRIGDTWTTLFIFPFDKDELGQHIASVEISDCLNKLNIRTLLFLRNIKEIEYNLHDTTGKFLREESPCGAARKVKLIGQTNGKDENEKWLVFERSVSVPNDSSNVFVELGFHLATKPDGTRTIKRVHDAPLVVYFPTEKDTELGFLIQGPYQTTLARDNVPKDEPWNKKLIEETAKLTVASLRQLKTMGLLTVSLLKTLPIDAESFPPESMFHPIFTRVRKALMNEDLLPADGDSFVAARNSLLARSAGLTRLLNRRHLRELFGSDGTCREIRWLSSAITQGRTPDLRKYLIDELKIREVTPDFFAAKIDKRFLADQSDEWISDFYCFLSDHKALWQQQQAPTDLNPYKSSEGVLRNRAILRLQDGSHVRPFSNDGKPNAFLLADADTQLNLDRGETRTFNTVTSLVKVELTQCTEALKFLKDLGIPKFDVVEEVLSHVLPKYSKESSNIPPDKNQEDLEKIDRAYDADSEEKRKRLLKELSTTPFIFCTVLATGKQVYRTVNEVYFRSNELCSYFEGDESFAYVDPGDVYRTLFRKLGVAESVRISRRQSDSSGHVKLWSQHSSHGRGLDGFDPDIDVDGLKNALDRPPTIEKSAFIWSSIVIPNVDCIRGTVESCSRWNYLESETKERISSFGDLLIGAEWLPDANEEMHKPETLLLEDLHKRFEPDRKVADQLAMKTDDEKTDDKAELCEKAGISMQSLHVAMEIEDASPEDRQEIDSILNRERPEFPQAESTNPERRRHQIRTQHEDAPQKSYDKRETTVRITRESIDPSTQLREWYTNNSSQMVCQVCKKEMPFKKRNGEYYFEAVEALSKEYLAKEHESQYLALCPLCAAKYKEFVKRDEEAMKEVRRLLMESDELVVPLIFGESETSVRFVQQHFIDLREILNARGL